MKKTLLCLAAFVTSFALQAQIANAGFENWSGDPEDPESWSTLNSVVSALPGLSANVTKTSDAHEGDYAVLMETLVLPPDNDAFPGLLTNGTIPLEEDGDFTGVPYTAQPTAFKVFYKADIADGGSASISIIFRKDGEETPVAAQAHEITSDVDSYTELNLPLTFTDTPDEMLILFNSGEEEGNKLYVDAVSLETTSVGLEENAVADFGLYPNPASDQFQIVLPEETKGGSIVEIRNVQAQLLHSESLNENERLKTIILSDLDAGVYFVALKTAFGTQMKKLIIH